MDVQALTSSFMWCTIINVSLLMFFSIVFLLAPDLVYRTQSRWFLISRETFNIAMYSFLGLFKIALIVFSLVPYLALLIIG